MITLQCKLTPEDYLKALYLHMRPSPRRKYLRITLLGLFCIFLVASAFSSGFLSSTFSVFPPILYFSLLYAFIRFVIIPWNLRQTVRRIFSQQKALQIECKVMISPEMIETISEIGETKMHLSDFYKYKIGKDLILLYPSQALFHMFPRRFFASEEDLNTFLSYLEVNLGSPKR